MEEAMADTSSIVVAVIALVGSLGAAVIGKWDKLTRADGSMRPPSVPERPPQRPQSIDVAAIAEYWRSRAR
jgi:hypothetical protein